MSFSGGTLFIKVADINSTYVVEPLDCARIACQARGYDVDAEPTGYHNMWKVTATSKDGKVTLSKKGSLSEACESLIESIVNV